MKGGISHGYKAPFRRIVDVSRVERCKLTTHQLSEFLHGSNGKALRADGENIQHCTKINLIFQADCSDAVLIQLETEPAPNVFNHIGFVAERVDMSVGWATQDS